MQPYKQIFTTRHHEMDMEHLLRVQCMCNYMEEAAGSHAEQLGAGIDLLDDHGLAWVLAKMRLCIKRRPGPGEEITVETWPVRIERVQFRRDFILYGPGNEQLATAVTQWVVMGVESRKLERFPVYVSDMEPQNPPLAQENGDIRLPAVPGDAPVGPVFPVRLADIDQNRHVNNGRYVDFSLEAADLAARADGLDPDAGLDLACLEVLFRSEARRGDVICARTARQEGESPAYLHSLFRESDGQELARCRTVFKGRALLP